MLKQMFRTLPILLVCLSAFKLSAQESSAGFENGNNQYTMRESSLSDVNDEKKIKPLTIGLEAGASIDMTGNDYSSFDVDVYGGYRSSLIKCLGIGAGFHNSFSSARRHIPIYAIFRSNLSREKSLFFIDLRVGYSLNHMQKGVNQAGFFGSVGLGLNLSVSKHFGSYILLGYNFYQLPSYVDNKAHTHNETDCHLVGLRLGISF